MLRIEKYLNIPTHKSYKAKKKCRYVKSCYKGYITYRHYYESERFLVKNIANLSS